MEAPFTIDSYNWAWTAKSARNLRDLAPAHLESWLPHRHMLPEVFAPLALSDYQPSAGSRYSDAAVQSSLGLDAQQTHGEKMVVFAQGGKSREYFPTIVGCPAYPPSVVATSGPYPFYESYPSGLDWVRTDGPSPIQRHLQLLEKLNFYQDVGQAIEEEIGVLKYDFLYDESTEIVRSQEEKLAVVEQVIKRLQLLQEDPLDPSYLASYTAAEIRASVYTDLYELRLRRTLGYLKAWNTEQYTQSALILRPIYAFLRQGQILRSLFKRRLVDIRRHFRTLVRTLFKQMDDQSGHDEFLASNRFLFSRNLFIHQNLVLRWKPKKLLQSLNSFLPTP